MKNLFRNVVAVVLGVFAGSLLMMLVQALNARFYPAPAGLDFKDPAAVRHYAATLPAGAWLLVLLSYLVGFTTGIFLAAKASATDHTRQGLLATMFFGAASVLNLLNLPHPIWFWVANLLVLTFAAWAGMRLARPKPVA